MIVLTTSAMVAPGRFVALEAAGEVPDIWRMEGVIELAVGDVAVLGVRHWDVIVPLWANLATALSERRGAGAGSLQFPDQNVEVALTRTSDGVRVSVRGAGPVPRSWRANRSSYRRCERAELSSSTGPDHLARATGEWLT